MCGKKGKQFLFSTSLVKISKNRWKCKLIFTLIGKRKKFQHLLKTTTDVFFSLVDRKNYWKFHVSYSKYSNFSYLISLLIIFWRLFCLNSDISLRLAFFSRFIYFIYLFFYFYNFFLRSTFFLLSFRYLDIFFLDFVVFDAFLFIWFWFLFLRVFLFFIYYVHLW